MKEFWGSKGDAMSMQHLWLVSMVTLTIIKGTARIFEDRERIALEDQ